MANDPVDVLIIGAGASGAAMAWSLADTRMHILCLEQGDWMNPAEYPSSGMDWEARASSDFSISPNRRKRDADYPINDAHSPISVANFNGVGGGTILYAGHFPRFHPSDFRVNSLDGVADDWPLGYDTLDKFYAENEQMMGVSGLSGDPAYPPKQPIKGPPESASMTAFLTVWRITYLIDRSMISLPARMAVPTVHFLINLIHLASFRGLRYPKVTALSHLSSTSGASLCVFNHLSWVTWLELNQRHHSPKECALTKLSYKPWRG